VKWINVLRIKPGQSDEHFGQHLLSADDLKNLKKVLDHWSGRMTINVDTALTCLMYTVPTELLKENAVYGCVAGIRFCTIDCNGDVFPCSFFKDSKYIAGNVLTNDFQELWLNSNIFKKFREMRKSLKGRCKDCSTKEYCGGCRSIVLKQNKDFYGEDEACIKIWRNEI
jgi:radical SAM protein with 4Fe4S-binding SPASM domain